jgi:hypothetical protein
MAHDLQEIRTQGPLPRPRLVLRLVGFGALLGFPAAVALISRLPYPDSGYIVFSSGLVLVSFIFTGAGFRIAGGVYRGAVAGFALYLLPAAAVDVLIALFAPAFTLDSFTIVYWGAQWPLLGYAALMHFLGIW